MKIKYKWINIHSPLYILEKDQFTNIKNRQILANYFYYNFNLEIVKCKIQDIYNIIKFNEMYYLNKFDEILVHTNVEYLFYYKLPFSLTLKNNDQVILFQNQHEIETYLKLKKKKKKMFWMWKTG